MTLGCQQAIKDGVGLVVQPPLRLAAEVGRDPRLEVFDPADEFGRQLPYLGLGWGL